MTKREQFLGIWGKLEQFLLVYLFPIAAVKVTINDRLKEHKFIILQLWESEVWSVFNWVKISVSAELPSFLEEGEFIFLPFPTSRGCSQSLAHGPVLSPKPAIDIKSFSHGTILTVTLRLHLTFKDLCVYTRTSQYWAHLYNPGYSPYFKVRW